MEVQVNSGRLVQLAPHIYLLASSSLCNEGDESHNGRKFVEQVEIYQNFPKRNPLYGSVCHQRNLLSIITLSVSTFITSLICEFVKGSYPQIVHLLLPNTIQYSIFSPHLHLQINSTLTFWKPRKQRSHVYKQQ